MLSETLARHLAEFDPETLPASTLRAAKNVLLDASGVMMGASGMSSAVDPFINHARLSSTGEASILGTEFRASASGAAFANGAMAHALDFEDAFDIVPGHPNASLVPALLALAQTEGPVDGRRFLSALALGCDFSCRMALALKQRMEVGGWYPPPILAGFGAVAGAAHLLGLNATQTRDAISLMLCQNTMPGEIKYSAGTQIRAVREAFPAQAAVQSVLLARAGVTGFEQPLEGQAGFYALYAGGAFDADILLDKLGEKFWIEDLTFKPWPSCRGTHAFIEMAVNLRKQHGFTIADISKAKVSVDAIQHMLVEPRAAKQAPTSAIEAKFSIPFIISLALARGQVTLDDFTEDDLHDGDVLALAAHLQINHIEPEGWQPGSGGRLEITLRSGEQLAMELKTARGCPARPMGDDELVAKFIQCAGKARRPIDEAQGQALAGRIMTLEQCMDVGALFSA